jgi:hypothetical protein
VIFDTIGQFAARLTISQCAVDFGTTYSGVAYAYFEKGQDVRSQPSCSRFMLTLLLKPRDVSVELVEDHWPGMGNQSSQKVPS